MSPNPQARILTQPALAVTAVKKSFGGALALNGANISLARGEVHGLLGANGAGKSTLSRVIAGHILADQGSVMLDGATLALRNPRDGLNAGIFLVTQETTLAGDLSVMENIFLADMGAPGRLSRARMRQRGTMILKTLGQQDSLQLDAKVESLSIAQRQLVEIAKALAVSAKVIIFDEPTSSLSPSEVDQLFQLIQGLSAGGCAVGFVSHRLEEVFRITDRVTVLREGRAVAESVETATLTQSDLIRLMVGQELGTVYASRVVLPKADRKCRLSVRNLRVDPIVKDISFDLHAGEILGLAGLVGAGRSEALEGIFGLRHRQTGRMVLDDVPFAPNMPAQAIRAGVVLVPEDRRYQAIAPDMTVRENLLLGHLAASTGFFCGYGRRRAQIAELLDLLDLPLSRLDDDSLLNLSGGMQQKIIIARWLLLQPKVLMLDEPTRGVDIATRASIYKLLQKIADEGVAVLVVSSDFEELLGLCERIIVISDGRSTAEVPAISLVEETLTLLAAPRSSMAQVQRLLGELVAEYGGTAFWGIVDRDRLVMLATAGDQLSWLEAGNVTAIEDLPIGSLLRDDPKILRTDANMQVVVTALKNERGHDNGLVVLALPNSSGKPDQIEVRRRVRGALAGSMTVTAENVGERL